GTRPYVFGRGKVAARCRSPGEGAVWPPRSSRAQHHRRWSQSRPRSSERPALLVVSCRGEESVVSVLCINIDSIRVFPRSRQWAAQIDALWPVEEKARRVG